MKTAERELARYLRGQGTSINDILKQVPAAKSSISRWIRDIELSEEQIGRIKLKHVAARERTIQTKRKNPQARIEAIYREAEEAYKDFCQDADFLLGLALYIGEGSKKNSGLVAVTNCDSRVIRKSIVFFEKIGVPREKIRCRVQVHPGLNEGDVRACWLEVTGFHPQQLQKVRRAVSSASQGKTFNRQWYGTCQVYACSTVTHYKLQKWMDLALS